MRDPRSPDLARHPGLARGWQRRSFVTSAAAGATLAAATRCLEPIVAKLALPQPKERDTHYLAKFVIIGP